jgi:hypothetical protein
MRNRTRLFVLVLILSVSGIPLSSASQSVMSYGDIHRLLAERPIIGDRSLTMLFGIGDEQIQDLIRALDDPNKIVRRNAQAVIRYLGNDVGMRALIEGYKKSSAYLLAGPIPLPLRDWDYEYIKKHYLKQSGAWDQNAASYIYALALDGSPDAVALLSELNTKVEKGVTPYHYALHQVKAIQSREIARKETDLAKLVVANAFFISSERRAYASGKLLGFNHTKDKALIEVNVGGVPLAEESYHIVLERHGEDWRFLSVNRVAVS